MRVTYSVYVWRPKNQDWVCMGQGLSMSAAWDTRKPFKRSGYCTVQIKRKETRV